MKPTIFFLSLWFEIAAKKKPYITSKGKLSRADLVTKPSTQSLKGVAASKRLK
jgi:hypothetical protein